ncbi:MAG: LuxR C-terminal-related transcriptional regulator [Nitrospirota bacterium]|nr:LuxR C-terminal-related transcriptional regulator [Nitrospirota bacterium]
MILRDSGNLIYPSPEEFQTLGEVMHDLRSIDSVSKLGNLSKAVNRLVPHEFSGCGLFSIRKCQISVGHSNYSDEFCNLYTSQGFVTDPAIQLLQTTSFHLTSSEDSAEITVPREILSLKLDFGIRSCFSVGVRGANGLCTYFVFSNFAPAQLPKLRTVMEILSPHLHLSYLRSSANETMPSAPTVPLTPREEEIMRWVSEGKTNWEISVILKVSLNTVRTHLRNVCLKLGGVENRWNAAAQWQWSTAGLLTEPSTKERHKQKPALEKPLQ